MISLEAYRATIGCFNLAVCCYFHSRLSANNQGPFKTFRNGVQTANWGKLIQCICMFLFLSLVILAAGDIERNPGPFSVCKVVQGTFHQGDQKFGDAAGTQCMRNSLFAICFSTIKNPRYWKPDDLNHILDFGSVLYSGLGHSGVLLTVNNLPNTLMIKEYQIPYSLPEASNF